MDEERGSHLHEELCLTAALEVVEAGEGGLDVWADDDDAVVAQEEHVCLLRNHGHMLHLLVLVGDAAEGVVCNAPGKLHRVLHPRGRVRVRRHGDGSFRPCQRCRRDSAQRVNRTHARCGGGQRQRRV